MTETTTHRVWLHDEIPRFGCGMRFVEVEALGPKWATLRCGQRRARVSRKLWIQILSDSARSRQRNQPVTTEGKDDGQ